MAPKRPLLVSLATLALAIALFGGILLYMYYPARPHTLLGWLLLILIGLPTWAFLEWLGEVTLQNRWFDRLDSDKRILLGVPVVIALMILGSALIRLGARIIQRL